MHTHDRLARLLSVSTLLVFSSLSFAQAGAQAPRIRGPIETSPSVTLEGSLNPHVRTSDDLGPLAPDTSIRGITLVFKRSDAQESDLQQLLAEQTNPSSPLYHHWLTPAEFATRFGLADQDIAATETWLQSHGFIIDALSPTRDRITFSGNAAQIQQAFGAELHRFRDRNTAKLHFAPANELSLPPALAPITAAVLHLSDFRPKPSVHPQPQYTTLSTQEHFLAPGDLYTMYDLSNFLSTPNGASPTSLAIVGESFVNTGPGTAIGNFTAETAIQSAPITPVIVPNSGYEAIFPGDVGESEIDLEYSSALLKDGSIFFVYTGSSSNYDVFDALAFSIASDIAPVVSISYGACEPVMSTTDLQQYNAILEQAAAQGQTIIASSGDEGAEGCASYGTSSGLSTAQQQQLAVDFPASSPYVTAVGGTQMAAGTFAPGSSPYWAPPTTSADNPDSLLSYVPEVAWNESSSSLGILGSGGGMSSIFARPAWQTGVPGIPSGSYRLVPDIALQASVANPGYLICTDDPAIIGSLSDCTDGLTASSGYVVTGGTSFAAPVFAALIADLNRYEQSTGLGNINPTLYSLAAQPSVYASAFHDITSGTTACAIGDGNCGTPATASYAATTGYDMATGLGSVDFGNLATAWPTVPANGAVDTWLVVAGIPSTATAGANSPVTITVNIPCTSGYCTTPPPSGSVYISVDGTAVAAAALVPPSIPQPLSASATWSFVAPSTTGSHVVTVRYPGDPNHLASMSTSTVLIGNVVPSGSFTLSAQNTTLSSNGTGSTNITITPSGGYSGALTWTSSYTGGTTAQTICYLVNPVSVNGPTTDTMQIGVGASCDSPSARMIRSPVQRSSIQPPAPHRTRATAPAAEIFAAFLLFGLLPSRRTRKLLPILSISVFALTITGCGGGNSIGTTCGANCGGTTPQPQVYTITMTAKDSVNTSITASTTFTLTVD